ncbi:antitoxin [Agrococcus baldri]|nr:antitoxin [Agrococcus baldri]
MRTTVNIDAELLAAAKLQAARTHQTIGSVIEDALRRALQQHDESRAAVTLPEFRYAGGLRDGVDLLDRDAMGGLLGESSR